MTKLIVLVIIVGAVLLLLSYYEHKALQINSSNMFNYQQLHNMNIQSELYKLYPDKSLNNRAIKSLQYLALQTYNNSNEINKFQNNTKPLTGDKDIYWFPGLISLGEIMQNDDNIFLIETSCGTDELMKTNGKNTIIRLNPRQCCAVESVAITNRNHSVYIFHTCPLNITIYEKSPEYVKRTLAQPNVHIVYLRVNEIIEESPVEELYRTKKISSSLFPVEHLSDVLRFLTLWKYGGTYMDFDTITIRQLDNLKYNYAGRPSKWLVANGVINFRHSGTGHSFVTDILEELNRSFDGKIWVKNGPGAITRTILRNCNVKNISQLERIKCYVITVYPPKYFYPIYYEQYKRLFKEMSETKMKSLLKQAYNIHFWNRISKKDVIEVGSNQVYGLLADKYCPDVYHNCGKYF